MKNTKKTIQKHIRYRGVVLLETAVAILLLLILTLGIIGFGYLFIRAQHVTYLARHGARAGSRFGADIATVTDALAPYMRPDESITQCSINTATGKEVTVRVTGTNLDILHITGLVPIANNYSASVTMAREGP